MENRLVVARCDGWAEGEAGGGCGYKRETRVPCGDRTVLCIGLYHYQYPSCMQQICKMLPMRKLGKCYTESLCIIFTTACESTIISK